ncbi:hypothetical protein [uncultured Desulfuromonas sp.]|uniref:hypothetical protein n=1 Tax=uncultured Desulfuromonas sp. TaxID=181013 RepID=UPI002AAB0EB7|nr:hypothetical protein [uncultured Desulfuromonas sp.]
MSNNCSKHKLVAIKIWVYLSNVLTAIGAISIFENLNSWGVFFNWLIEKANDYMPVIADLLLATETPIHEVIILYRSIIHPFLRWPFQWIPFRLPDLVVDFALISLILIIGLIKLWLDNISKQGHVEFELDFLSREIVLKPLLEICKDHHDLNAKDLADGVTMWNLYENRNTPPKVAFQDSFVENMKKARRILGPKFYELADNYTAERNLLWEKRRKYYFYENLSYRILASVWLTCITFLIIDGIFY